MASRSIDLEIDSIATSFTLPNCVWQIVRPACNQQEPVGRTPKSDTTPQSLACILSGGELKVARLMALGHSNKKIATDLFLSYETVKTHVKRIIKKLDAHSRTEAAIMLNKILN